MEDKEKTAVRASWARVLLLLPFVAVLWVPFYNSIEPKAFGVPFFYWWQLLWVVLGTVVVGIVYRIER
jgi:hypothetical protein